MRPKRWTYTLAALHADGYLAAATGTGPFTTIAAQPGDGLAHPVTIASSADLRTWTFTLTGTDANGRTITEDVAGANAGTATSTKYFATITSVVASKTLGANTMDVGWTAVGVTPTIPLDQYAMNSALLGVDIGGTVTFSGQETNGDVYAVAADSLLWSAVGSMSGVSADTMKPCTAGATGLRVSVASHTTGTLGVTVTQSRHAT